MSRKTRRAYEHVFRYIKDKIFDLQGQSMMTDFECAMRNAIRTVHPDVKLLSCWFHFTQAVKKRAMQSPQLIPYLQQNEEGKEIYYKLMSLPLLPPDEIFPEFEKLKILALANHKQHFLEFIKYFEFQWLKKV